MEMIFGVQSEMFKKFQNGENWVFLFRFVCREREL